jgi:nitroreductase
MADRSPTATLRAVRQIRQYAPDKVPDDIVQQLLEVVRWTGSSQNTQPWHFVVITDAEQLRQISVLRPNINWVAAAPMAIALVFNGANASSEAYDEGRVTERLLIAAHLLGLGAGTAHFGGETEQAEGKRILGIPEARTARSIVTIGRPTSVKDPRPNARPGGRKPLSEIVSYGRWGKPRA